MLRGFWGLVLGLVLVGLGIAYVVMGTTAGRVAGIAILILGAVYVIAVARGFARTSRR
jgi:hypothetical protein